MDNRTKIIATLGPACDTKSVISSMIQTGMDVCRLNFSHGTYAHHAKLISLIRTAAKELKRPIAIMQDLQGPKIRIGKLKNDIVLKKGEIVVLGSEIPVQYKNLHKDVKTSDRLLIDDGLIELRVIKKHLRNITCRVITGGLLKSNKGINAPNASISAPVITKKDLRDIAFGVKHGVDFVALSFVKSAVDIKQLRKILKRKGSHAHIIAKIERYEAIKNLETIIEASDAVMVARGDLGIEVAPEHVPILQKKIIRIANQHAKPAIVATQMLQSMVNNPYPTRAEISDAATAIFDHADAFMLSNETAVGKYPVKAVNMLRCVASSVEHELKKEKTLLSFLPANDILTDATCFTACSMAQEIHARYIIALTQTGYTAYEISKHRPITPMIVFTPNEYVARRLSLVWGVVRSFTGNFNIKNSTAEIKRTLLKNALVKKGDTVVICNTRSGKTEKMLTSVVI